MIKTKHIINKVFLEVNTSSTKKAFDLKDNLGVFLKEQVFPSIENYFEAKSATYQNAVIRFNKLELRINHIDLENLNNLKDHLIANLKKKIDEALWSVSIITDKKESVIINNDKSDMDALFFFLETGGKPWWKNDLTSIVNRETLLKIVLQANFKQGFLRLLAKKRVQERLINQFNDTVLSMFLSGSIMAKKKTFSGLKNDKSFRIKFWKLVIDYTIFKEVIVIKTGLYQIMKKAKINTAERTKFETYVATLIGERLEDIAIDLNVLKKSSREEEPQQESSEIVENDESVFIDNAGIILLHPFLKNFFINTELSDLKGNLLSGKIETAIHLLHYLSTKREQQLESELVFEKFLCGYPIDKPIERYIKLSADLKQKSEELLQSTITHWPALKNTSSDGLRTGFFQREGKLIIEHDKYRLIVERKAQDILLDRIPWNIHIIKLPWLDKLVFVEW